MFLFLKTKKIFQVQKHIGTFQRQNPDLIGAKEQLEKRFEKILTIEYDTGQRAFEDKRSTKQLKRMGGNNCFKDRMALCIQQRKPTK